MPKISNIQDKGKKGLDISKLPWLRKAIGSDLVRGGIYLLAGEPGIGKTTLSLQVLGELARQGVKVLYLPTEQSMSDIKRVFSRLFKAQAGDQASSAGDNLYVDTIDDLKILPWFLSHQILPLEKEYHGCQVITIDSLQGGGLGTAAGQTYKALLDFIDTAKGLGITCLLVNHVTKRGEIAGPKALEHAVDCVIYIRRALRLRPLFVPKNRFGPAMLDPIVLTMEESGLRESPHVTAQATTVLGYSGVGEEFAEAQASVTIPSYGSPPGLNAPFLPSKKIKQLLKVLGTLKDIDVVDLSYDIACYLPGRHGYVSVLDLPITIALLSSYLHQEVDNQSLFVGEVDLTKQIRPPERRYLAALAELLVELQPGRIGKVYLSERSAQELKEMRPDENKPRVGDLVEVHGVRNLEDVLQAIWPDLMME
jgi:DNA repair protein RadA/Sms